MDKTRQPAADKWQPGQLAGADESLSVRIAITIGLFAVALIIAVFVHETGELIGGW